MSKRSANAYAKNQFVLFSQFSEALIASSEAMNVRPFEVLFTVSYVMENLSLNRYYAKKFIDDLREVGAIVRLGNRYKYNVENEVSMSFSFLAVGY